MQREQLQRQLPRHTNSTDVGNCGGCGITCSTNHIQRTCAGGVCSGGCASGFADTNGNKLSDGCEISLTSDPNNCGSCNSLCPGTANGSPVHHLDVRDQL